MLGAGTQSNPYIISTPSDLDSMRNNRARGVYYELTNDIDMSSWGNWNPIAYYDNATWVSGFEGNLDGKGFKIKNLTITKSTGIYLGLFGQAFYGTIQNVGLENVTINGSQCRFIGALVGYSYSLTVKNCYVAGGNITSQDESGGLLGKVDTCTIENCYSTIPISLNTSYYGGGLIGAVDSNTTIRNSYSSGRVTYSQSSSYDGKSGFVGFIRNNTNIFFENCFYDKEISTQVTSPANGINAKTTTEMKTQSTFTGWDTTNTWSINNDYPILKVFGVPIVVKKETVSVNSYSLPIYSIMSKSQKSTKQLNTFTNTIKAATQRNTATLRSVSTYLSHLDTYAEKFSRTVRSGTANVTSFISPIGSFVNRESKTVRNLIAHIKPSESDISVLVPIIVFTPNAYVATVENSSRAFKMEDMSNVSYIVNPSHVEVMK
ncbi:hypothetical protein [Cytobacillus oceanisediminis]|uniref:hypothetical protein n=1 Tax=Cytobacillus oceanisediminis TaxID=665099 RepID=UPI001FB3377C|nr:hypothetical protein [Cytobacillus oceanisediminis]UOE57290.1 hypothetical protein IRB79_11320 [Cytobacillus oceanisediminis]